MLVDVAASSSARRVSVAASSSGESGISCTAGAGWPISTSSREGHDSSRSLAASLRASAAGHGSSSRAMSRCSVPGVATAAARMGVSSDTGVSGAVALGVGGTLVERRDPAQPSATRSRSASAGESGASVSSSSGGRVGFSARGERANAAKRRPSDWAA